jgi:hypothetical protein
MCLYVYPSIVARQRLGKNVTAATNTRLFYAVRVVSKESRLLVLPRTSCFFYSHNSSVSFRRFRVWIPGLTIPTNVVSVRRMANGRPYFRFFGGVAHVRRKVSRTTGRSSNCTVWKQLITRDGFPKIRVCFIPLWCVVECGDTESSCEGHVKRDNQHNVSCGIRHNVSLLRVFPTRLALLSSSQTTSGIILRIVILVGKPEVKRP